MKRIKPFKTNLKFLFFLGPILAIMGISAGLVSGIWGTIPLGLLTVGLSIIAVWLLILITSSEGWGQRSTQAGTNALLATVAVLVILGLINYLGTRHAVRVDLTENQLYTLSTQSQQVLRTLQQPVKLWIFDPNPNPQDRELLENYRRYSSQFNYEFVDPQQKPALAKQFNIQSAGQVSLESAGKRQPLQEVNEQQRLSETKITNGIESLLSDRTINVYFLQGHGETSLEATQGGFSQALTALKDKNYKTTPLNLAERASIPKDATIIVVAGAKRALFEAEVKALRDYLAKGGSLLLMIDPNTNPGLDSLLLSWGVTLDNRLAIDASENGRLVNLGPATALITNYGNHPITKDFGNGISFYPLARPIETVSVSGVTTTPLLLTSQQSWAESNLSTQQLQFNPESDRPGPLTLAIALNRKSESNANSESRLVIFGNSTFASDGWFEQQLNSDVFLNSIGWLSKQNNQSLSIRPKEQRNRRLNLSGGEAAGLAWSALLIMPILGFTMAGLIWWRRR